MMYLSAGFNTLTERTWFGAQAVVEIPSAGLHRAGYGHLLLPHPPVVNGLLRYGLAQDARRRLAALTSAFPILITLSVYKLWVFAGSGAMLALAAWMTWRPGRACPTEPGLAKTCDRAGVWNRRILTLAIAIWGIGFFAAFALYPLVRWWDGL